MPVVVFAIRPSFPAPSAAASTNVFHPFMRRYHHRHTHTHTYTGQKGPSFPGGALSARQQRAFFLALHWLPPKCNRRSAKCIGCTMVVWCMFANKKISLHSGFLSLLFIFLLRCCRSFCCFLFWWPIFTPYPSAGRQALFVCRRTGVQVVLKTPIKRVTHARTESNFRLLVHFFVCLQNVCAEMKLK